MRLMFAGFAICLFFLLVGQVRELFFYWRNGWDFSKDSEINWVNYYHGEDATPQNMMSNEARVFWGRPFFIVVLTIFAAITAHIALHPEQWRREVDGSEVIYHYVGSPKPDAH